MAWNPNPATPVVAVAAGHRVLLFQTRTGTEATTQMMDALLRSCRAKHAAAVSMVAAAVPAPLLFADGCCRLLNSPLVWVV